MYPYGPYDPADHGEEAWPDLTPEAIRRFIASDPLTHGEDRNPNADPQIIKNILGGFHRQEEDLVADYKKAVSYVIAPDPHSGQEYSIAPHPPQMSTSTVSAYVNTAQYYGQMAIDTWMTLDSIRGQVNEHVDHFRSAREETAQAQRGIAQASRETSAQLQTEQVMREQGTAVIQTEIPLLDERRAALAGSNDQTRIATEAEAAFTAARAQSVTQQQAMVNRFMQSLTQQDAWLTGGSRHASDASAGGGGTPGSVRDSTAEERARLLASPPPSNLQEIYRSQFEDHDMSGFRDAEHWWQEHVKHVAKLDYGYAQGTAFAPGGLALVGEMGPELVNLPRGSQVIPNPRLGGDVHVHVNVEGSVVAERDLAQRLRQELIRTSRRTVDLGFN